MSVIKCNTSKLKEVSNEFNYLLNQYNQEVINIYELITLVNENAWSGNDAKNYVDSRLKQKDNFEQLGQELTEFAQKLENCQVTLESNINQIRG